MHFAVAKVLAVLGIATLGHTAAIQQHQKREADFASVRTRLLTDHTNKADSPLKYFHESDFHPHYDGRFGDHALDYLERKRDLSNLVQTYLSTLADIGVDTWIMHGTLMGWWWNRKILPWDSDIDVQVSYDGLKFLASYYNMSIYHFETPRIPEGRDYLLEINPHFEKFDEPDRMNVIDARWIDTYSGLYIDITAVHPRDEGIETNAESDGSEEKSKKKMVGCKDGHKYEEDKIFPLHDSLFEGTPVKIPNSFSEVLAEEYGKDSLTKTVWEKHRFDDMKMEWIPDPTAQSPMKGRRQ